MQVNYVRQLVRGILFKAVEIHLLRRSASREIFKLLMRVTSVLRASAVLFPSARHTIRLDHGRIGQIAGTLCDEIAYAGGDIEGGGR